MMVRGDKLSIETTLDVEILGFYPAGEQRDGKAKYVCTINGYKMMVEADFLEYLKNFKPKEEKKVKRGTKNGRK